MTIVEAPNPWVLQQFYNVVNHRYEDQRSIIFTADDDDERLRDWSDLGQRIGQRTYSRLYAMCGPPVPMFGEDNRVAFGHRIGTDRGLM